MLPGDVTAELEGTTARSWERQETRLADDGVMRRDRWAHPTQRSNEVGSAYNAATVSPRR